MPNRLLNPNNDVPATKIDAHSSTLSVVLIPIKSEMVINRNPLGELITKFQNADPLILGATFLAIVLICSLAFWLLHREKRSH